MPQSTLHEVIAQRRKVRSELLAEGHLPYPQDGKRTHTIAEALAEPHDTLVTVCGRIRSWRGHGKLQFLDIHDESGTIQAVMKADDTENFDHLNVLDVGDFVRIQGGRMLTHSNEESVLVARYAMLTKTLRPLPDSYYGFTDEEERYRRRYLDLLMNPSVRETFRQRSRIIASVRHTLEDIGFMEVETPTLQPLYGGANARPFVTEINAFDSMKMYLKISDELYLKRLIVGGFDRVYEIDKDFRNEGVSNKHNPEFTMMECYAAYSDYRDMMELTEQIYRNAAIAARGSDIVPYDLVHFDDKGNSEVERIELNFRDPWRRLSMYDAIKEILKIDVTTLTDTELQEAIWQVNGKPLAETTAEEKNKPFVRGLKIVELFEATEPNFVQPTFIIDFPRETTALCKPHRTKPGLIERFEPYIAGMEVGNAYTELNDPVLQRDFMEDERGEEAHPIDEDFIEALEYGMPPTGGLGLGIDRMVMLLTNSRKIRDVLFFPIMRPRA